MQSIVFVLWLCHNEEYEYEYLRNAYIIYIQWTIKYKYNKRLLWYEYKWDKHTIYFICIIMYLYLIDALIVVTWLYVHNSVTLGEIEM